MSNSIIFILPSEARTYHARQILKEKGINIPIYEAFMEEGKVLAGEMISKGTKVIISRGSTVQLLREAYQIPIIEIRYSFHAFCVAMQSALEIGSRVALVGHNNAFDVPELADLFSVQQLETRIIPPGATLDTLKELKALGIQVIITGPRIAAVARSIGLAAIVVQFSESTIIDAVKDAIHLRNLELAKEKQFGIIANLLEQAQEGLLSINQSGRIISQNLIAQKILRLDADIFNSSIYDYLPSAHISTILKGFPIYNEVLTLHNETIFFSGAPTHTGDEITGAVLTLLPATDIRKKEYELRKRNHAKGHIAKNTFDQIIGNSSAITKAKEQALRFAETESNVLIYGPTGTGKELFAQSIHNASRRSKKPFVAINCAALPESILESELFGYVKGAFTGARTEGKAGIFEQAHTGTIFLDEISEVSPAVQSRLLRVIQEREVSRIGDDKIIPVDVRIIASTNRNLQTEIQEKRFREDLYYRLSVLNLRIPPLQQRVEDIPLLCEWFLRNFSRSAGRYMSFTSDALEPLMHSNWPGNIRQLRNVIECAVALCREDAITRQHMENVLNMAEVITITEESLPSAPEPGDSRRMSPEQEYAHILEVLQSCGGNKTQAAKRLGIGYSTLWRKLKQHGAL